MTPSKPKRALASALILVVFTAHVLLYNLLLDPSDDGRRDDAEATLASSSIERGAMPAYHRRGNLPSDQEPERKTELDARRILSSRSIQSQVQDDNPDYDFAVLLISYHKTGHDLQEDLIDYIKYQFHGAGPKLTEHGSKSPYRSRHHKPEMLCAKIQLRSGHIMVYHAPDLFCTPTQVAQTLVHGGKGHAKGDRGVKVVHMVRNPFEMAVSNYHYHARIPTPEPWVKHQNPCDIEYTDDLITHSFPDMIMPTLFKTKYASLDVNFGEALLSKDDLDDITKDCLSLYQTKDELRQASFLDHLMNYDVPDGLRLATAQLMVQGDGNGGDILRMANNIVKLKQAQMSVASDPHFAGKELRVYTMSLDDFISQPAKSAYDFFDFILPDSYLREHKLAVAHQYEEYYHDKMKTSYHMTHGDSHNTEEMKQYLRQNSVFGNPLSEIERLVKISLESRGEGS